MGLCCFKRQRRGMPALRAESLCLACSGPTALASAPRTLHPSITSIRYPALILTPSWPLPLMSKGSRVPACSSWCTGYHFARQGRGIGRPVLNFSASLKGSSLETPVKRFLLHTCICVPSFGKHREQGTKSRSPSATRLSEASSVPRGVPGDFSREQTEGQAHSIKQSCVPLFPHIYIYKGLLQPACLLGVPLFPLSPAGIQHWDVYSSRCAPGCAHPA